MEQSREERNAARSRELEERAEEFQRQLVASLGESGSYELRFKLNGLRAQITVVSGPHQCTVNVTNYSGVLRYYGSFLRDSNYLARGGTPSCEVAVEAAKEWLQGVTCSGLSERYPFAQPTFILERMDFLRQMEKRLVAFVPQLAGRVTCVPQKHGVVWPFDHLRIDVGSRSCRLALQTDQSLKISLFWECSELCSAKAASLQEISVPIQRWICEGAMPSQLKAELTWVEIVDEELVPYYEQGLGWEGICLLSWKRVDEFYLEYWKEPHSLKEVQNLMEEMRSRGFDRTLRAGTSIFSLVLSRSWAYGLREDQPRLAFWFLKEGMEVKYKLDAVGRVEFPTCEYTVEIDGLLRGLEACEVD